MSCLLQDLGGATTKTGLPPPWSMAAKSCDNCKSSSALLFCIVDSSFLCMSCDSKMHNLMPNKIKHEKVWICEVCEQAPASFTCKADAATLCITCDRDIHSANPLARRHERIPVVPFFDTAESLLKTTASTILTSPVLDTNTIKQVPSLDSWIFPDHVSSKFTPEKLKSVDSLLSQPDQLLEYEYTISTDNQFSCGSDSVVPVEALDFPVPGKFLENLPKYHFEIDFSKPNMNSCNNSFTTPSSLINSASSSISSIEVGVVPDGRSMSEKSFCLGTTISGGNYQGAQELGMDRKARVLRYREKRKNRKFEKTIRYASRKAYAEKRPRIKGRFAKRTGVDVDGEIDQLFPTTPSGFCFTDSRYGVVPTFQ